MTSAARAEAFANIALAKYWGKSARGDNLTAVPSLSLTLEGLSTRTEVAFDPSLAEDEVTLNGKLIAGPGRYRVVALLGRFRALAGDPRHARVDSENNFPTAAGLASSASGFAALAVATGAALELPLTTAALTTEARRGSASAGRSLYGGFVELLAETDAASPLAPRDHWDVCMVIAIIEAGPKPVTSTSGMVHTALTSPYYPAWVAGAEGIFREVRSGVLARDFERVATFMEHSTRLMHATMLTSLPPVLYLRGTTVELMHEIAGRRKAGVPEGYTMDAGPNVKVLTTTAHAERTAAFLTSFPGVSRVLVCPAAGGARILGPGPLKDAPVLRELP